MRNLLMFSALALAAASQATVIYSFENGVQGFSGASSAITVAQSTIGATQGNHSLAITFPGGWSWSQINHSDSSDYVKQVVFPALAANTKLKFDLTLTSDMNPFWNGAAATGGGGPAWTMNWKQDSINPYPYKAGTHTIEWAYGGLKNSSTNTLVAPTAEVWWTNLAFMFSDEKGGTIYLDNIQAVPEPGTLAAMGLGLAALLRRRRKA